MGEVGVGIGDEDVVVGLEVLELVYSCYDTQEAFSTSVGVEDIGEYELRV